MLSYIVEGKLLIATFIQYYTDFGEKDHESNAAMFVSLVRILMHYISR